MSSEGLAQRTSSQRTVSGSGLRPGATTSVCARVAVAAARAHDHVRAGPQRRAPSRGSGPAGRRAARRPRCARPRAGAPSPAVRGRAPGARAAPRSGAAACGPGDWISLARSSAISASRATSSADEPVRPPQVARRDGRTHPRARLARAAPSTAKRTAGSSCSAASYSRSAARQSSAASAACARLRWSVERLGPQAGLAARRPSFTTAGARAQRLGAREGGSRLAPARPGRARPAPRSPRRRSRLGGGAATGARRLPRPRGGSSRERLGSGVAAPRSAADAAGRTRGAAGAARRAGERRARRQRAGARCVVTTGAAVQRGQDAEDHGRDAEQADRRRRRPPRTGPARPDAGLCSDLRRQGARQGGWSRRHHHDAVGVGGRRRSRPRGPAAAASRQAANCVSAGPVSLSCWPSTSTSRGATSPSNDVASSLRAAWCMPFSCACWKPDCSSDAAAEDSRVAQGRLAVAVGAHEHPGEHGGPAQDLLPASTRGGCGRGRPARRSVYIFQFA